VNWEELNAIIQRHGGAVSAPVIVDPEIDNPSVAGRETKPKIPNPNPTYRYNLKDGKYFTAKATQAGEGTGEGEGNTFQIIDPGSAVQPLTPSDRLPSAAQDLVKLDARGNVILPTDADPNRPAAKLRDPSTGAVTDLDPKGPAEGTLKEFGNQLLNIKPDGTYDVVASKPAEGAAQQAKSLVDQGGAKYEYDPAKPEGSRLTKILDAPPDKTAPTTKEVNGQQFQWDPGAGTWKEAPGLPAQGKPATASTNTGARWIVFYDDKGNEVSRQENPNFVAPTPQQLTPDAVSQNIPLLKADGTIDWVPNQNRVPAGQAMQDLLSSVGVKVNAGELSMADAKDMLTGTVNAMNAQTARTQAQTAEQAQVRGAASDILTTSQQGAQTGASLINQRVQAAQGMLNSVLGLAGQGQRSGNMGGGLMSAPAGLGQALIGGIQGWTEQLGGGADVYKTAANLVRRADPSSGANPQAQVAYGVLGQMLEKYQQVTGQPHPLVAQAQQQGGGPGQPAGMQQLGPQQSSFSSPPAAAAPWQRADQQFGAAPPGNAMAATPGVAGAVNPGSPNFMGSFASPPAAQVPLQRMPEPWERGINYNPNVPSPQPMAPPPVTIRIGG
jgi:hypothetical protein